MIREYQNCDEDKIVEILQQGMVIFYRKDIISFIKESSKIFVYESKEKIKGFATCHRWGKENNNGKIMIYVLPEARREGIGTKLYQEIIKQVADSIQISTDFRKDKWDATPFFVKYGYHRWYGMKTMRYFGVKQKTFDLELDFVPYQDSYFEQYVTGLCESFYPMRKENNFKPFQCCALTSEKRQELLDHKETIFIALDHGHFIGSASVKQEDKDTLGPIFIVPNEQGKGYGRFITQCAINKALSEGIKNINLEVVEWNIRAVQLYESLGFKTLQIMESFIR